MGSHYLLRLCAMVSNWPRPGLPLAGENLEVMARGCLG